MEGLLFIFLIWLIVLSVKLYNAKRDIEAIVYNGNKELKKKDEQIEDLYYLVNLLKRDKLPEDKPNQDDWWKLNEK